MTHPNAFGCAWNPLGEHTSGIPYLEQLPKRSWRGAWVAGRRNTSGKWSAASHAGAGTPGETTNHTSTSRTMTCKCPFTSRASRQAHGSP